MPASDNDLTQGNGDATPRKERDFSDAIEASLGLSYAGGVASWPYWHIDLNAGSGWNERPQCEGSPLVFLHQAIRKKRRVNVCFCDLDGSKLEKLKNAVLPLCVQLAPGSEVAWVVRDNALALADWGRKIAAVENPACAIGSVLADPNGPRQGFPLEALAIFAAGFPRMDLIFSLNVTLFRSALGCRQRQRPGFADWPTVREMLRGLPRAHWLISNFQEHGVAGHRYAVLVGRTSAYGYKRYRNFYPIDLPEGRVIIDRLRRVADGQGELFPLPGED
jgi:hypothetical protein